MDAFTVCHDIQGDEKTNSDPTSGPDERLNPELTAEGTPTQPVSQPPADEEQTPAAEPFQPILQLLTELERDDPKLAFQAARILGLYRRLWDSCMSKHIGCERLVQTNQELTRENARLENEKGLLLAHHDEQLSQFDHLNQALEASRGRLISILNDWEQCSEGQLTGLMNCERG
ncbi:hypothetical protein N7481_010320 [Penicillium waksmanii]|uniref:uncharacterized protein n=1 Tax=Penicillium waksmanii TaxID=69791 RepID=UPI00254759A9|nr:uncharacterized protein N7481_010320 [Penicillium waksmanii]KAJ5976613.1 hypothetical protein N7481_010320 [Penicillium waksmanii]